MFYKLKDTLGRKHLDITCREITAFPPVLVDANVPIATVTMLQSKDIIMYLLAIHSFSKIVELGHVFVLNDGSLLKGDKSILLRAIPSITILDVSEYKSKKCPEGGCWERLIAISELCKKYYVIQLDADTLTIDNLEEVQECLNGNMSFTLGTYDDQRIEAMEARSFIAKQQLNSTPHIQTLSEACFRDLKDFKLLKYARGCAGFAGFPQNSFTREYIEEKSEEMFSIVGNRWSEWGSEQVMSNIVVANAKSASLLPHPKYCSIDKRREDTSFLHFIGSVRFKGRAYARCGRKFIIDNMVEVGGRID